MPESTVATSAHENATRHFEVQLTAGNHFAWLRTRLALERTVMAWVRTSVALIGFGFTIVQFFERLNTMEGVAAVSRPYAARYVGLALIATGVFALADFDLAVFEQWCDIYGTAISPRSPESANPLDTRRSI